MTQLIVAFRNFVNAPQKITLTEMDSELQGDVWCAESRELSVGVLRLITGQINV